MVSPDNSKVVALKNAIISKINGLIATHNSNGLAHSDIRNSIPTKTSDLTADNMYTKLEIDELIGDMEEDMLS